LTSGLWDIRFQTKLLPITSLPILATYLTIEYLKTLYFKRYAILSWEVSLYLSWRISFQLLNHHSANFVCANKIFSFQRFQKVSWRSHFLISISPFSSITWKAYIIQKISLKYACFLPINHNFTFLLIRYFSLFYYMMRARTKRGSRGNLSESVSRAECKSPPARLVEL
jgi:hypothetical protein